MIKLSRASFCVAALCFMFGSADAALIYGTTADAATYLCLPACTSGAFDGDGAQGTTSASATQDDTRGLGFASADLSGPISTPVLKAKGAGDDFPQSGAASGVAFALQGYEYTGATIQEFTLNISFTGLIISAAETFADSIIGRVALLETDVIEFESSLPTLVGELGAVFWQDVDSNDAFKEFSLYNSTGGLTTINASIVFDLAPGDAFYLHATLAAGAFSVPDSGGTAGAIADASQSLTMSFSGPTGDLSPIASSVVPIPPTMILFGSALSLLGWLRAKKS